MGSEIFLAVRLDHKLHFLFIDQEADELRIAYLPNRTAEDVQPRSWKVERYVCISDPVAAR